MAQEIPYKLQVMEDSLVVYGQDMFAKVSEPDRIDNNFSFVRLLVNTLKESHSFNYDFKKLDMISIVNSPDQSFRLFSWNIPLDDGSFLYYGSVQFKTEDGSLKLIPLLDQTFEIEEADQTVLPSSKWYGAQYYEIIPLKERQYIVVGWKGHTPEYTQKVIDILSIDSNGDISFGDYVFSDDPKMARKIFNYTRQASMYLRFHEDESTIFFDHIIPVAPEMQGEYKYYGPDLSYDAYQIKDSKLIFLQNVELLNREEDE